MDKWKADTGITSLFGLKKGSRVEFFAFCLFFLVWYDFFIFIVYLK